MVRLAAVEQLVAVLVAGMQWMSEEDQAEVLSDLQRRAAGADREAPDEGKWGGGYRSDVESVSAESFREEARRGVNG